MAGAIGAIIGPLSEGMASAAQYQASKHERRVAWKHAQQWAVMEPGLRMEGLRKAGLNPMLAATGGFPSRGYSEPGRAEPGQLPRFDYDPGKQVASAKQARFMDEQYASLVAERKRLEELSAQEVHKTDIIRKYGMAQAERELHKMDMEILNIMAGTTLSSARQAESMQSAGRTAVDRLLLEMGIPGARAMEELYTKYPWLRQIQGASQGGLGGAAAGAAAGAAGYLFGRERKEKSNPTGFGELTPRKGGRRK